MAIQQTSLEENIQQWVQIDNQIKFLTDKTKGLREARTNVSDKITSYVETNNLTNAKIEISDGQLKFQNTKITPPLTFKFIEQCLKDVIPNEKQVEQIIQYIKEKREFRYTSEIKRTYSNN